MDARQGMLLEPADRPVDAVDVAFSLRREKSVADARTVLLVASVLHPDEAMIAYNLACYSCVEGDIETATVLLKQAFELEPDLKKTALDDPDLDSIFGANYSEGDPVFSPPHLPDLNP